MRTLKFLAFIGVLAILGAIAAGIYFFGGYYTVAGTALAITAPFGKLLSNKIDRPDMAAVSIRFSSSASSRLPLMNIGSWPVLRTETSRAK
jgi:hypothetical protein